MSGLTTLSGAATTTRAGEVVTTISGCNAPDMRQALLAMLPRGRAWGEGGPAREPGGLIYQFWAAVADVFTWVHDQICALALEFNCATASTTLDLWNEEYGLPDGCDPYANVCAKVAATGGVTCAYYQAVALELGWSIACGTGCALDVGLTEAGMAPGPVAGPATLIVNVYLAESPAYAASSQAVGYVAGFLEAGMAPACGPDLTSLDCILQRIVGAHMFITYAVFAS